MIEEVVSLKSIFDSESTLEFFDKKLFKELCALEAGFVNKKQEHIEFFGGNLTGVQRVVFTQDDRDKLLIDMLGIDEDYVRPKILDLPDINSDHKVSTDVFNHACIWLMHKLSATKDLSPDEKVEAQVRVAMYLNYRFLTSILVNMFKYPANPDTARATYEQMSMKFILKAKGSWGALIRYRSEEIVAQNSIWRKTIDRYDDDYDVVKMLNDVQGRIKSIMKNIMSLFIQVHNQGSKIHSTSIVVETDGEMVLKDKTKNLAVYTQYLISVIPDTHSFIRPELIDIILDIVPTAPPHYLRNFLDWFSKNYAHTSSKNLEQLVEAVMEHSFEYLSKNNSLLRNKEEVSSILIKLRGTYTSSRATEPKLMEIKQSAEKIIAQVTKSKNHSAVSAVRTAFCLYLIIRAYTKKHYST